MTLDPSTKGLLDAMKDAGAPPLYELPVDEARAALRGFFLDAAGPETPIARTQDRTITSGGTSVRVRLYWPDNATGPKPILLFYHGGGFALGGLDDYDNMCRNFATQGDVIVVSVDYRRSPEHPFPAAPTDCYAALCWAAANASEIGGDPARIAVFGDSAGGNLAAAVTLMARDQNGPAIALQVLAYPILNLSADYTSPSRTEFGGGGYFLAQADIDWVNGMYVPEQTHATEATASPLLAPDLAGLPKAHVITAGHDVLRDEGTAYADRLREAGVAVETTQFDGTIHGFLSMSAMLEAGKEGQALIARTLVASLQV